MTQAPLFRRIAALAFVACLAASTLPLATAAEDPANGARDPIGDVYPTAWAVSVPGTTEHADLLDLAQFTIAHESKDSFVFEIQVGDLPDDWILKPAPPGGRPIPPIVLPANKPLPTLPDGFLDNKVNHSVYFSVGGKDYAAIVSLAEFNLRNVQEFPFVNSTVYLFALLEALMVQLQENRHEVESTVPLVGLPRNEALTAMDTAIGAVGLLRETLETSCMQPAQTVTDANACDVLDVTENEEVNDAFDDVEENLAKAREAVNQNLASTLKAQLLHTFALSWAQFNDTKAEAADLPGAELQGHAPAPMPGALPKVSEEPTAFLFHRFSLFRLDPAGGQTKMVPLGSPGGVVSLESNTIQMTVQKRDVGAQKGATLSKFRAEAAFKGVKVDYAPDAVAGNPGPQEIALGVVGQQVVTPAYGKDYAFAHQESPPGSPPAPASDLIRLSPVGASTVEIQPGGSATYYVTLKNVGGDPLTGFFSLSPDAPGWTSQINQGIWSIGAGASQVFTVVVAAAPGATGAQDTIVTATIDGGDSASTDLHTTMKAPAPQEPPAGGGQKQAKKGRLPGFESAAALAALAALVVLARRRLG